MLTINQLKSRLPQKSYSWLYILITTLYVLANITLLVLGVSFIYFTVRLKVLLLVDLILLQPFLSINANFLLVISVLLIVLSAHGFLSVWTSSYSGALMNAGLLLMLLCMSNSCMLERPGIDINSVNLYDVFVEKINGGMAQIIAIDKLQQKYSCCGIHNYTDWVDVMQYIPGSCCDSSTICYINDPSLKTVGCSDIIKPILNKILRTFTNIYISLNMIGMITIFMAFWSYTFFRDIKQNANRLFFERQRLPRIQYQGNFTTPPVSSIYPNNYTP